MLHMCAWMVGSLQHMRNISCLLYLLVYILPQGIHDSGSHQTRHGKGPWNQTERSRKDTIADASTVQENLACGANFVNIIKKWADK